MSDNILIMDDCLIGRIVKKNISELKKANDEQGKLLAVSAAFILLNIAVEANADKFTQTIEGFAVKGQKYGDWEITVQKIKSRYLEGGK